MAKVLPIIRGDYTAIDTYKHADGASAHAMHLGLLLASAIIPDFKHPSNTPTPNNPHTPQHDQSPAHRAAHARAGADGRERHRRRRGAHGRVGAVLCGPGDAVRTGALVDGCMVGVCEGGARRRSHDGLYKSRKSEQYESQLNPLTPDPHAQTHRWSSPAARTSSSRTSRSW